jgi:hypothetical protein
MCDCTDAQVAPCGGAWPQNGARTAGISPYARSVLLSVMGDDHFCRHINLQRFHNRQRCLERWIAASAKGAVKLFAWKRIALPHYRQDALERFNASPCLP